VKNYELVIIARVSINVKKNLNKNGAIEAQNPKNKIKNLLLNLNGHVDSWPLQVGQVTPK
jgi:hypothetical protein